MVFNVFCILASSTLVLAVPTQLIPGTVLSPQLLGPQIGLNTYKSTSQYPYPYSPFAVQQDAFAQEGTLSYSQYSAYGKYGSPYPTANSLFGNAGQFIPAGNVGYSSQLLDLLNAQNAAALAYQQQKGGLAQYGAYPTLGKEYTAFAAQYPSWLQYGSGAYGLSGAQYPSWPQYGSGAYGLSGVGLPSGAYYPGQGYAGLMGNQVAAPSLSTYGGIALPPQQLAPYGAMDLLGKSALTSYGTKG